MTYAPRTAQHHDIQAVTAMAREVQRAKDRLHVAVTAAHDNGSSWQTIGDALGISRQAAHERFGHGLD